VIAWAEAVTDPARRHHLTADMGEELLRAGDAEGARPYLEEAYGSPSHQPVPLLNLALADGPPEVAADAAATLADINGQPSRLMRSRWMVIDDAIDLA
jgi:hypothetical protein